MNIIDLQPRTPDWHAWRALGIGASESSIIMAKSPYKTQWQLWAEKCGFVIPTSLEHNPHVQRGIRLEPKARAYIETMQQELLLPLCAESNLYPFIKASFDGLNSRGEPVEIKCPSLTVFNDVIRLKEHSEVYQLYCIQVQHQLLVSGSQIGWLVFYQIDEHGSEQIIQFEIKREEAMIQQIIEQASQFWLLVQSQKPPTKCPLRDTFTPEGEALTQWESFAAQYHQLDKEVLSLMSQLEPLKAQQSQLQQSFFQLMNGFTHAEYAGIKINRYWSQGQVDYPKLLMDLGHTLTETELAKYRKSASEKSRVTIIDNPHAVLIPEQTTREAVIQPSEVKSQSSSNTISDTTVPKPKGRKRRTTPTEPMTNQSQQEAYSQTQATNPKQSEAISIDIHTITSSTDINDINRVINPNDIGEIRNINKLEHKVTAKQTRITQSHYF